MPKNNTSVEELVLSILGSREEFIKKLPSVSMVSDRNLVDQYDFLSKAITSALTHLQEQTRKEEQEKLTAFIKAIFPKNQNNEPRSNMEVLDYIDKSLKMRAVLDSQEGNRWCQGCLIKLKENAIRCSYCGKEAKSYYTDNDFDDNGEIKV